MANKRKIAESATDDLAVGQVELPRFPSEIWTPLGMLPVLDKRLDDALGDWDNARRIVRLDTEISPVSGWQTIGHELMHSILDDSGVSELLRPKQEEAICRAFGSYYAAYVLSGGSAPFAHYIAEATK
jgi:hypothetical protein